MRSSRFFVAIAAVLWLWPAPVFAQLTITGAGGGGGGGGGGYVGPGDINSIYTAWIGLRAYNAAYATGSNAAVKVSRASDSATQDILIKTDGTLDIASANTFACGVSSTCGTCVASASGTVLTLTSCTPMSSIASDYTISGSPATGTITQPAVIVANTCTGIPGTCTLYDSNISQSFSGTISVQVALSVTEAYDQTGNAHHFVDATAANQPRLVPICVNGKRGMMFPDPGQSTYRYLSTSGTASLSQTFSIEAVSLRSGRLAANGLLMDSLDGNSYLYYPNTADTASIQVSSTGFTASATDQKWHSLIGIYNGSSSIFTVDGVDTTGTVGAAAISADLCVGDSGSGCSGSDTNPFTGFFVEGGWFPGSVARATLCHNQYLYWHDASWGTTC